MADINNTPLQQSLPNIMKRDADTLLITRSIDERMKSINQGMSKINLLARPDSWTAEETAELAWQFNTGFYDPTLPIEQLRALVQNTLRWHRKKGTNSAVEEIITTLFESGRVEDWYQYGGSPGHFRVITDNPAITTDQALEFIRAIDSVKRLTAKLDEVIIEQYENMNIYFGHPMHTGEVITI